MGTVSLSAQDLPGGTLSLNYTRTRQSAPARRIPTWKNSCFACVHRRATERLRPMPWRNGPVESLPVGPSLFLLAPMRCSIPFAGRDAADGVEHILHRRRNLPATGLVRKSVPCATCLRWPDCWHRRWSCSRVAEHAACHQCRGTDDLKRITRQDEPRPCSPVAGRAPWRRSRGTVGAGGGAGCAASGALKPGRRDRGWRWARWAGPSARAPAAVAQDPAQQTTNARRLG